MLVKGKLVAKLPKPRVNEFVSGGKGERLDRRKFHQTQQSILSGLKQFVEGTRGSTHSRIRPA